MFPGQGSQSRGMGADLFDEFAELTKKADKILGYSIKELCLEDPRRELNKTQFTQPALYVVNALSYYKKIKGTSERPDYVIGHSLGEFNALLAAECFDFEAGLKLVKKRGELMSQVKDGAMAAILNASKEEIESILNENDLTNIDLANYNTPSQIVISGLLDEVAKAEPFFQQGKILYYPLNTSGAFHSRFMQPSKEKFQNYLKRFKLAKLTIPVVSNVMAQPYENKKILETLASQISSTVKWSESVEYLMALAKDSAMEFEEIGHGDVLTKMVDTIKRETGATNKVGSKQSSDELKAVSSNTSVSQDTNAKDKSKKSNANSVKDEKPQEHNDAENLVGEWNLKYPVGTKVKSTIMDYDELETRTEALVLFGHRAAVYMKDYNGYFDLNELKAI